MDRCSGLDVVAVSLMNEGILKPQHSEFYEEPPTSSPTISIYICIETNGNPSTLLLRCWATANSEAGVWMDSYSVQCKRKCLL